MSDARFDADFVERIVREVIRRLLERGVTVAPAGRAAVASSGSTELALTGKLVTMETVRDRLAGVLRVTVARTTIVTPAVRDELKKRKIELTRQD